MKIISYTPNPHITYFKSHLMIISLLCDAAIQVEWRRLNKQLGDGYRDGGSARTFDATCSSFFSGFVSVLMCDVRYFVSTNGAPVVKTV